MAGAVSKRAEADVAAQQAPSPKQVLTSLLERNKSAIGLSLPKGMDQDRFVRLLLTATVTNPDLLECDPLTFLRAGVLSAQLGLEPNDPREEAFLIPFKDRKKNVKVVNFIIGYKGLMKLARQSGMVSAIYAYPVFEGDRFTWTLGMNPNIEHDPNPDHDGYLDPKALTHTYAVAKVNGEPQFRVVTRKEIDRTMRSTPTKGDYGPWKDDFVAMAVKTAIRRLCGQLPQSPQMAQALTVEDKGIVMADLPALGPSGSEFDGDDVIDVDSSEDAPAGVDTVTGEVIDTTSTEDTDVDGRPF